VGDQPQPPDRAGLGEFIELPNTEMYGEPFTVPEPMETVFISWYEGGEVFRSGLTFQRGAGRIFYFSPGHETYPIYHNKDVHQVLRNAVKWAHNPAPAGRASKKRPTRRSRRRGKSWSKKASSCTSTAKRVPLMAGKKLLLLGHRRHRGSPRREFARFPNARLSPASMQCRDARRLCQASWHRKGVREPRSGIRWGGFDAAINATPDGVHKETTLALIAAGKHVFCEKPLAPKLCRRACHDRGGGTGRLDQHGQPDLPQFAGSPGGARHGARPARSASCAMSRPVIARAGW
jgi:hypothetical protein